jgi:hypothetical protein
MALRQAEREPGSPIEQSGQTTHTPLADLNLETNLLEKAQSHVARLTDRSDGLARRQQVFLCRYRCRAPMWQIYPMFEHPSLKTMT